MTTKDLHEVFEPANGPGFDTRRAYFLGQLSEIVYPSTVEEKKAYQHLRSIGKSHKKTLFASWNFLSRKSERHNGDQDKSDVTTARQEFARIEAERVKQDLRPFGFDRIKFFSGASTQCFLAGSGSVVVLCFRGTEPARLWDIYADLMALPVAGLGISGLLHGGFWNALKEVWQDPGMPPLVWPEKSDPHSQLGLGEMLKEFIGAEPARVWLCGHSLGGALATLAASRLVADGVLKQEDIAGVYTFGQPRVGDATFCRGYPLHGRHFRLVNDNDIVTRVPPESLKHVESAVRMFLGTEASDIDKPSWFSRLSYRHVGQLAFLTKPTGPVLGISTWDMIKQQLNARFTALFSDEPWMGRVFPGAGDHSMSKYNSALSKALARNPNPTFRENFHSKESFMTDLDNNEQPGRPTPMWISFFSSIGAGLLIGYLVGMAVSEVVGIFVGGLATGLAALLGLSDRNFTTAKGIRIGTFCFSAVAGALIGTTIRTHQLLSPQVEARTLAEVQNEYAALGFDKSDVLGLMKNYINSQNKVRTTIAKNSVLAKAQTTAHFSGGVALNVCNELSTPHDKTLSSEDVIRNFQLEGGPGWADFAKLVEIEISEPDRKEVLFMARDAMCDTQRPLKLEPETCDKIDIINESGSLSEIEATLNSNDRLAPTVTRAKDLSTAEDRTKALILISGLSCSMKS